MLVHSPRAGSTCGGRGPLNAANRDWASGGWGGRIRWRDLHAATGILLSVVLIGYIVSGLTWSRYWGRGATRWPPPSHPGTEIDARRPRRRHGGRLRPTGADASPGRTREDPVYASAAPAPDTVELRATSTIAKSENMIPASDRPAVDTTEDGQTTKRQHRHQPLAAEALRTTNPLPDQFSGQTIANATADQDGAPIEDFQLGRGCTPPGNQYGVLTCVLATGLCLGLLTSIATATAMVETPPHRSARPARPDESEAKSHMPRGFRRRSASSRPR